MDAAWSNGLGSGYMIPFRSDSHLEPAHRLLRWRWTVFFFLLEIVVLDNKMTIDIDTLRGSIRTDHVECIHSGMFTHRVVPFPTH